MSDTTKFQWVAVRGRDPKIILGFLRLPASQICVSRPTMVAMDGQGPCMIEFSLTEEDPSANGIWQSEIAIRASDDTGDRPLSFWRALKGFVEAVQPDLSLCEEFIEYRRQGRFFAPLSLYKYKEWGS
jgi:hypothetical protein